jgi:hypothetical protein
MPFALFEDALTCSLLSLISKLASAARLDLPFPFLQYFNTKGQASSFRYLLGL